MQDDQGGVGGQFVHCGEEGERVMWTQTQEWSGPQSR